MQSIEYIKASDGTANASVATVQSSRSPGATTIDVDIVAGINPAGFAGSMGTPHTFTDPVTSETITVISEATCVDFTGHVDGSNLEIDTIAPGYTDLGSEVGDIIIIRPTTQYGDNLAAVLETSHDDTGALNAAAIHSAMPAGAVIPFAGAAAPTGFLLCDGSSKLRADYADLFTAISTTFGSADGTHFNVPDMRSRVPLGVGAGTFTTTFAAADVNTGTDVITVPTNTELQTGQVIQLTTTGTLPTGLSLATDYYIVRLTATTIQLASSLLNSLYDTPVVINITGAGSGTNTITQTLTNNSLGAKGGEETSHNALGADAYAQAFFHDAAGNSFVDAVIQTAGVTAYTSNERVTSAGVTSGVAATTAVPLKGNTNMGNNLQPFLALNYIIKTQGRLC